MNKITLADLLTCDESGTMLVAEDRVSSALVHIDEAKRGLECDCICAACRRPVLARHGAVRLHSFAHYHEDVPRSCAAAGETALHKFAKSLIAEKAYLSLPQMVVQEAGETLIVREPGRVSFDRVELEQRQGDVIPDVVCYLGRRKLYVEFKVTHGVGEEKKARLRGHNATVLEIDLSNYRNLDLMALEEPILDTAPRAILQSELLERGKSRLRDKRFRELEKRRRDASQLVTEFRRKAAAVLVEGEEWQLEAIRHQLDNFLDNEGSISPTMLVDDWVWKLWTIWTLLHAENGMTARQLTYFMLKNGWVKKSLFDPDTDLCALARATAAPEFRSAVETVADYLGDQQSDGIHALFYGRAGKRYYPGGRLKHWFEARKRELDEPYRRLDDVRQRVAHIVKLVSPAEKRGFTFEDWIAGYLSKVGLKSWQDLCGSEGDAYRQLLQCLDKLSRQFGWKEPELSVDLLGLPVEALLETKRAQWRQWQEDRRRQAEERALVEADLRANSLDEDVSKVFGGSGNSWSEMLITYDSELNTPIGHARQSIAGFAEMRRLLELERQKLADEEAFERTRLGCRRALIAKATASLGTPERAELWVRSQLRDLGMQRPSDYCVDERTLATCLQLLPARRG